MPMVDGRGISIGLHVESASPAKVKLLEATLDTLEIPGKKVQPECLIADRGDDSNQARQLIEWRGMLLFQPEKTILKRLIRMVDISDVMEIVGLSNGLMPGYKNFRRLVVRYERSVVIFTALIHMAFAMMILKKGILS